ncbi:SDR family NAD(P)-dependent oxidoreductase [Flavobacterium sp. TMP13]|uniref:SDR family NAD(P)-dependent oxidoreductase n=1 Tax=Flavobacterium sp. TMP13 TaxID=3425950 RepID=UPI003D7774A9
MKQISILGCGWLGLPLAKALLDKEFAIKGSTTSDEKRSILEKASIKPFVIDLGTEAIQGDVHSFLEGSEILIIDIPPKLRKENSESFIDKIKLFVPFIEESGVTKVIFVSSTSVYGKSSAEGEVTENTLLEPETESGKQLVQSEEFLHSNTKFKTTVLRFGGLIGPDRHPITSLVKKVNTDANAPLNLIDQKDCIAIISEIIKQDCWGETFNAASPMHPTKKEYYSKKAVEFNLPEPQFTSEKTMTYKIVSSAKLEHILNYTFQVAIT